MAALVYVSVAVATWALLRFTTFGHHIYAVGGSSEASRLAGIRVQRVTVLVYVLGAVAAAIGGLILLGQTSIGQPAAATAWPLAAIAAVAIAGVPLTGGSGGIGNVVVGTLLLGVVSNALNLFGVSPYWQPAFIRSGHHRRRRCRRDPATTTHGLIHRHSAPSNQRRVT